MRTGLSGARSLRQSFPRLFCPGTLSLLAAITGTFIAAAGLTEAIRNEMDMGRETPVEIQAKAAQLWRNNGYEVTGFKSYEELSGSSRAVTLVVQKHGEEQRYQATAVCRKTCSIRKIELN
jgi:hypothetical protein